MSTQAPLVSALGIWYGYFGQQTKPGDTMSHVLDISDPGAFGNDSLFSAAESGVAITHRALVQCDIHADCEHEVAIERTLGIHIDKAGAILERGQSIFVAGCGNAGYQGILENGHIVKAFVSAPGDKVAITGGYISVSAQPI